MRYAAVLLTLTVAVSAAPPVRLDLKLSTQEWISAAQVNDDASGVIVVAQTRPRSTRIVRFAPDGATAVTRVEHIAINHFEPLPEAGADRYLLAGSVDGRYVHRVVEWKGNVLRTIWDSSRISPAVLDSDPYIRVSRDGSVWGTVAQANGKLRFTWGELAGQSPRATISVESSPVEFAGGFVFDGTDLAFVRPNIAAVLWSGRIYLFDLAKGSVAAMLAPAAGGATLEFDHAKDTLWVGGNEWAAFSVRDALQGGTKPLPVKRRNVPDVAAHALTRVSPAGRAMLVATEGPLGSTVEIRVR